MESKSKNGLIIAIVLLATITVGVGAQSGWFAFILDLGDIAEGGRRLTEPFVLTDLPDFFEASVSMEGSGYTGQLHTGGVSISHIRPDSSIWLAAGTYSLDLELASVVSEIIDSGTFTDLRLGTPYVAPSYAWTPSSPAESYDIVLTLDNIVWTILPEYTIVASAGVGGSITPEGSVIVEEGEIQSFTISADSGYAISDVLVDSVSEGVITSYSFIAVDADHTIEAIFVTDGYVYSSSRIFSSSSDISFTAALFDGSDPNTYSAGETVNFDITILWDPVVWVDLTTLTYDMHVDLEGEAGINVIASEIISVLPNVVGSAGTFHLTGSFVQPTDTIGPWQIELVILSTG